MSQIASTFKNNYELSGTPIENARRLPLETTIGNIFKIEDAETVKQGDTTRVTYSVRTLNSKELPIGTLIKIGVKNSESVFSHQMALNTLKGSQIYTIRFDGVSHWILATHNGLREGLSADKAEIVNVAIDKVINNE